MISYDLTEEEIEMIEELRQKKKIDRSRLDKRINIFIDLNNEFRKVVCELYDLYCTNDEAREIICSTLDHNYLHELYVTMKFGDDE